MLKNWNLVKLAIVFAIFYGLLTEVSTVLAQLITPFGYDAVMK